MARPPLHLLGCAAVLRLSVVLAVKDFASQKQLQDVASGGLTSFGNPCDPAIFSTGEESPTPATSGDWLSGTGYPRDEGAPKPWLMDRWVEWYKAKSQKADTKSALIRVGVMGSGKTTSIDRYLATSENLTIDDVGEKYRLVDMDQIIVLSKSFRDAMCLEGDVKTSGVDGDYKQDAYYAARKSIDAYQIRDKIVDSLSAGGYSFSVEQTGWSFCYFRDLARKLFKFGNDVHAVMAYVPYFILKDRIELRGKHEGRQPKLTDICDNTIRLLDRAMDLAEEVDSFAIISNDVGLGQAPELMFKFTAQMHMKDRQRCSEREVSEDVVTKLLRKVRANAQKYMDDPKEESVFNAEVAFLERLRRQIGFNGEQISWNVCPDKASWHKGPATYKFEC